MHSEVFERHDFAGHCPGNSWNTVQADAENRMVMGLQTEPLASATPSDLDLPNSDLLFALEMSEEKSLYDEMAKAGVFLSRDEIGASYQEPVSGADADEWRERIESACARLNIQNDPQAWTEAEVIQWCADTLQRYDLPCPQSVLKSFEMDGTKLCLLSPEDFASRAPEVGGSLYAELVIWRNVRCLSSVFEILNFSHAPHAPAPSYLDLDTVSTRRHQTSSPLEKHKASDETTLHEMTSHETTSHEMTSQDNLAPSAVSAEHLQVLFAELVSECFYSQPDHLSEHLSEHLSASGNLYSVPEHLSGPRNPFISEACCPSYESRLSSTCNTQYLDDPLQGPEVTYQIRFQAENRSCTTREKQSTHLWQFLKELLNQPSKFQDCIRWMDQKAGTFKIEDSVRVAELWGQRKHRPAMNYDKLSRSIRQYYKKGIIRKTAQSKRLVYQFCPKYL